MLVCGMILGNVVSANAETKIDTRQDECRLEDSVYVNPDEPAIIHKDTDQEKVLVFTDDEKSGNTDSKAMLDAADAANEAASKAAVEVGKLTDAIDELKLDTKIEDAVSASNSAVTTANGAVAAANVATSAAASASGLAVAALDAKEKYDAQLALDQEAIDSINLATVAAIETVASEAAIEAQSQADRAKELMDIALTGNAKDDKVKVDGKEKTVVQVVEMIGEAAEAANTAYITASSAAVKAEGDLTVAIHAYNVYAVTYGEPLYGEDEVTYLDDDREVVFDGLGFTDDEIKAIESQRALAKSFDNDRTDALSQEITDCTASVENAKGTVQAAKDAADDAKKLFDVAKDKIEGYVEKEKSDSHEAIERVADRTAGEAKAAREAYEKKEGADKAPITSTNLDETKKEIEQNNKNIAEQEKNKNEADETIKDGNGHQDIIGLSAGLFSGNSVIETCRQIVEEGEGWQGAWTPNLHFNSEDELEAARKFVKKYDDAVEASKTAQELIDLYTEKGKALEKKEIAETEAAKADNRVAIIENRKETLESIVKKLAEGSDEINQIEYDKALNAWANTVFDKYKDKPVKEWLDIHDDAITTRVWMDSKSPYGSKADSFIEELLNSLGEFLNIFGVSQWTINTEKREAIMNEMIESLRAGLAEDEKLLAAAKALEADSLAGAATVSMAAIANSIDVASKTAVAAEEAVKAADEKIETARSTIATAKSNLAAAKAAVSDASIKGAKLEALKTKIKALKKKIEAAEEAVKTAEEELTMAEASKSMAEYYKTWANELITDQTTRVFKWDEDKWVKEHSMEGSYELILQNNATFTVDYLTLRNYIKEMLQYNEMPKSYNLSQKKIRDEKVTVAYFEIAKDENGKRYLTGNKFDSVDKLPNADAEYLVPYQFSCFQGQYHLDGAIVTTEYKELAPSDDNNNNNSNYSDPSNYINPSNIVVNNNQVEINNDKTPQGSVPENTDKTPVITVNDDKEETPQGAVPNTLKLGDDETAQGAALPKTGTAPVAVFYFAAVALLLAALYFKKSFAKEN